MSKGKRMSLIEAEVAGRTLSKLLSDYDVKHLICGSLRRGTKPTVGDIDIVVSNLQKACVALGHGFIDSYRRTIKLEQFSPPLNLYVASEEEWGAMSLFLTGNQWFNITTRARAKKLGYKLNQYGLWDGDKRLAGRTEEDIFRKLGMRYVSPSEREK